MSRYPSPKPHIWFDTLVLLSIAIPFLLISWQRWVDPIWDFGREAYVPWRIINGEILYKDLSFLYGAFPPYWNALLFKVFGPSLQTLFVANLLVTSLMTALIYRFFYLSFDRITALLTAVVFLCLFVFNQFRESHNMYYIMPFSHSYFYALFFGLCSLNLLRDHFFKPSLGKIIIIGVLLGLMMLSRLEIFLTFIVPVLCGLTFHFIKSKKESPDLIPCPGFLLLGIILAVIPFFLYFLNHLPWHETLSSITGFNPHWKEITQIYLYKLHAGYTSFHLNLMLLGIVILFYLGTFVSFHAFCIAITLRHSAQKALWSIVLLAVFIAFHCYLVHTMGIIYVYDIFRGEAVLIIALTASRMKDLFSRSNEIDWKKVLAVIIFAVWSLFMLAKVHLRVQLNYYALIYAMPGALITIAFLVHSLPQYFEHTYKLGWAIRAFVINLLLIACFTVLLQSIGWISLKETKLSHGPNTILAFRQPTFSSMGTEVDAFLQWSKENIKENETFVTFPEGIMLNFLTGHLITSKHPTYMVVEMMTYSEESMLALLRETPPDYFLYINKEMFAYGNIIPCRSYGIKICDWVDNNYAEVWTTGKKFGQQPFGITVLKKKQ
jgi:hypothetical protein